MRFEIFKDIDGLWRWNAKYRNGRSAGNGGEPFASERNVRRSIEKFINSAIPPEVIEIVVVKRRRK